MLAPQEQSSGHARPHIPYRNSLLTAMLKDSLGGNCATAMLATISSEAGQLEESIATCRFAQRVAMITNEARIVLICSMRPTAGCVCCVVRL